MVRTPTTVSGVVKTFGTGPKGEKLFSEEDVRVSGEGLEVTCKAAGVILGMKPSSVRRRHYREDELRIEGEVKGRDLWLRFDSVMNYMRNRKPAGRPVENGAGLRRKRSTSARAGDQPSPRRGAKKSASKAAVKKRAARQGK